MIVERHASICVPLARHQRAGADREHHPGLGPVETDVDLRLDRATQKFPLRPSSACRKCRSARKHLAESQVDLRPIDVSLAPDAADSLVTRLSSWVCDRLQESSSADPDKGDVAARVVVLRFALYAAVLQQELALLDEELTQLKAREGIASAELAARVAQCVIVLTMRRAWWLARWRLRERLLEAARREPE